MLLMGPERLLGIGREPAFKLVNAVLVAGFPP
jgi:hypothetical protein